MTLESTGSNASSNSNGSPVSGVGDSNNTFLSSSLSSAASRNSSNSAPLATFLAGATNDNYNHNQTSKIHRLSRWGHIKQHRKGVVKMCVAAAVPSVLLRLFSWCRRRKNTMIAATVFSFLLVLSMLRLERDIGLASSISGMSASLATSREIIVLEQPSSSSSLSLMSLSHSNGQPDSSSDNKSNLDDTTDASAEYDDTHNNSAIERNQTLATVTEVNPSTVEEDPYMTVSYITVPPANTTSTAHNRRTGNYNDTTTTPKNVTTRIVIQMNGLRAMDELVNSIWAGNMFCSTIRAVRPPPEPKDNTIVALPLPPPKRFWWWQSLFVTHPPQRAHHENRAGRLEGDDNAIPSITVNITFSCQELFVKSDTGSGNFLQLFYMMRLTAAVLGRVDLHIVCFDAMETSHDLIVPWFTGQWMSTNDSFASATLPATPRRKTRFTWLSRSGKLDNKGSNSFINAVASQDQTAENLACATFIDHPTGVMIPTMQYDLRKMAIGLVGTIPNHPSSLFAERYLWNQTTTTAREATTRATTAANTRAMTLSESNKPLELENTDDYSDQAGDYWNITSASTSQLPLPRRHHPPLFPNIEFDDAVIHFRCGDLLTTSLPSYGFMTFGGYVRHISRHARTIGILTQPFGNYPSSSRSTTATVGVTSKMKSLFGMLLRPFGKEKSSIMSDASTSAANNDATDVKEELQQRNHDAGLVVQQRCRTLVMALKKYIAKRHPKATIRIRNDPNETIALTYARMIMAKQVIGAMSTFSVFPVVGSFGTGYFLRPWQYGPSTWLNKYHPFIVDPLTGKSNVVLFDEEKLALGAFTRELWESEGEEAVLAWFNGS